MTKSSSSFDEIMAAWRQAVVAFAKKSPAAVLNDGSFQQWYRNELYNSKSILRRLWQTYTIDRQDLSHISLSKKENAFAYLLGFHLVNVARAQGALERVKNQCPDNFTEQTFHVIDVGCGSGSLTQAACTSLGIKKPQLTMIDTVGAMLDMARFFGEKTDPESLRVLKRSIADLQLDRLFSESEDSFHVILVGYAFNELRHNKPSMRKFETLLNKALSRRSLVLILDPANQNQARDLMEYRDEMTQKGWKAAYPCPNSEACPMLPSPKDWCYSEFSWQPPKEVTMLEKILDVQRSQLASSAYVFVSPSAEFKDVDRGRIVVGRPKVTHGLTYLYCDQGELKRRPILDYKTDLTLRGEALSK